MSEDTVEEAWAEAGLPEWLLALDTQVRLGVTTWPPPDGSSHQDLDGMWVLQFWPAIFLVGDSADEADYDDKFEVDISKVVAVLDSAKPPKIRGDGENLCVEGTFQGHPVHLDFLWDPPDDAVPVARVKGDEFECLAVDELSQDWNSADPSELNSAAPDPSELN